MKLQILQASTLTGKTNSEIITMLMMRIVNIHNRLIGQNQRVRYQERNENRKWKTMHLTICFRDYEYFLDLRKFCKRSVSSLVALAVSLFLDEIINSICNRENKTEYTDNNQFKHYILFKKIIDNTICWEIYWGLPHNIDRLYRDT